MMDRTSPVRKHTRFPVRWPVVYGSGDFMSGGTVLDVTHTGWRVAGAMPVQPGMQLTIQLWPSDHSGVRIDVASATVLWVKGCEFALHVPSLSQQDRDWITGFLTQKLSLSWLCPAAEPLTSTPSMKPVIGCSAGITRNHEASIQRDILRQIGMGSDYRLTIAQVRRECRRIVGGIRARHLHAQAGQHTIQEN